MNDAKRKRLKNWHKPLRRKYRNTWLIVRRCPVCNNLDYKNEMSPPILAVRNDSVNGMVWARCICTNCDTTWTEIANNSMIKILDIKERKS